MAALITYLLGAVIIITVSSTCLRGRYFDQHHDAKLSYRDHRYRLTPCVPQKED